MQLARTVALAGTIGAALSGCGGGRSQIAIGPVPPRATSGLLAGPLCQTENCTCRTGVADAGFPEGGRKRFEIRLGPTPHELWVTAPNHVLYKSPERAEMCFYLDLAPGEFPLELRASNPEGVSAALQISELGTETRSWYDTFAFSCGARGTCSFAELEDKRAEYGQVKRNLHDACGSTKIKGVAWDTGKSPDQLYPSELVVRLTLDVYKFAPSKIHGDPSCGKRTKGEGEPEAAEPATPAPAP